MGCRGLRPSTGDAGGIPASAAGTAAAAAAASATTASSAESNPLCTSLRDARPPVRSQARNTTASTYSCSPGEKARAWMVASAGEAKRLPIVVTTWRDRALAASVAASRPACGGEGGGQGGGDAPPAAGLSFKGRGGEGGVGNVATSSRWSTKMSFLAAMVTSRDALTSASRVALVASNITPSGAKMEAKGPPEGRAALEAAGGAMMGRGGAARPELVRARGTASTVLRRRRRMDHAEYVSSGGPDKRPGSRQPSTTRPTRNRAPSTDRS